MPATLTTASPGDFAKLDQAIFAALTGANREHLSPAVAEIAQEVASPPEWART